MPTNRICVTKPCNSADCQIPQPSVSNWFSVEVSRDSRRAHSPLYPSLLLARATRPAVIATRGDTRGMRANENLGGRGKDREGYGPRSGGRGIIARGRRLYAVSARARALTLIVCARIIVVRANGILLHAEGRRSSRGQGGEEICERACTGLELNGLTSR